MYKATHVKTRSRTEDIKPTATNDQRFFCFSKKIVAISFIITVILVLTTILGSLFTERDMTVIGTLTGAFVAELSVVIGGYLWKAKSENKIKLINQLIKDNADKYGIDAVIQLAGIVLSDT